MKIAPGGLVVWQWRCGSSGCGFLHRPDGDPREDLDLASYGIVKVLQDRHGEAYPDMTWEPKTAFGTLADHHRG